MIVALHVSSILAKKHTNDQNRLRIAVANLHNIPHLELEPVAVLLVQTVFPLKARMSAPNLLSALLAYNYGN